MPLAVLLVPILIAMVVAMVGDIVGPSLINEHPLWQITMNPRNRWLLLAAPQVAAWPFFLVGFARLVAIDPLFYLLGLEHGDVARRWAERRLGDEAGLVRKLEQLVRSEQRRLSFSSHRTATSVSLPAPRACGSAPSSR